MKKMTENIEQLANSVNQIIQSLDGTIAQIESLNRGIAENSKQFMESITAVNENMRLIIEVIKKQRENSKDSLTDLKGHIDAEIDKLWENKSIEAISGDQIEAVKKLKNINNAISDNLYMAQLLSIIQSLREITGRALAVKLQKKKK
jgi:hypothetical protein